jgi:hypothetical protein
MRLPENMFFYALDQRARHPPELSALIFGYPSDMGSKSLAKHSRDARGPEVW